MDYSIPFGQIASIVPPDHEEPGAKRVRVALRSGEELELEPAGDLGKGNAGMLIFADDLGRPAYLPWADVAQVAFDHPPAVGALLGER